MHDPAPGPRGSAWRWYAAVAIVLLVLGVVDLLGIADPLGG